MSEYLPLVARWRPLAVPAARTHGVPVALILATIAAESGGEPYAYRAEPQIKDASSGLMQVLRKTARALGYGGSFAPTDEATIKARGWPLTGIWEPAINIGLGAKLLGQNLRAARPTRGDTALAVAVSAYNAGFSAERPGDAKRTSTGAIVNQDYVDKVLRYMARFELEEPDFSNVESGSRSTAPSIAPVETLKPTVTTAPTGGALDIRREVAPVADDPAGDATGRSLAWALAVGAVLVLLYLTLRAP